MAINKSTLRTIDVLELLATKKELTLTEISDELQMPMSSTSDIMQALQKRQMVELADERARTYKIGVKNFLIGNAYLSNISIVDIAKPYLIKLSEQTKNTAFLARLSGNDSIVYLHKCEPIDTFVSTVNIGSSADVTVTALGKVILAYNEWLQKKMYATKLPKVTANSITDVNILKEQLKNVIKNKYALDRFEYDERVNCVAFPIFDQNGKVEHSFSVAGGSFENRDLDKEIELGLEYSKQISLRLGFTEN